MKATLFGSVHFTIIMPLISSITGQRDAPHNHLNKFSSIPLNTFRSRTRSRSRSIAVDGVVGLEREKHLPLATIQVRAPGSVLDEAKLIYRIYIRLPVLDIIATTYRSDEPQNRTGVAGGSTMGRV